MKATVQLVSRGSYTMTISRTMKSSACLSFVLSLLHCCFQLPLLLLVKSQGHCTFHTLGKPMAFLWIAVWKNIRGGGREKRKYRSENAFNALTLGPRTSSPPLSLEGRQVSGKGGLHTGVYTAISVPSGQLFMRKQCRGAFCGWRSTG